MMWRRNFAWKMSSLLLGGGLAFAFQVAGMRYLGPRNYGYWSLAIGWSGLFAVLVDYGFNPLLSRDIARQPSEARRYLQNVIHGKVLLAVPAGLALFLTWRYFPAVALSGKLLAIAFLYLCFASVLGLFCLLPKKDCPRWSVFL
jgi:O-antigen/teichoic acid export membrane protein